MKFELNRLIDYSDEAMLDEVRRVVRKLGISRVTQKEFNAISKVSPSALRRRFGTWRDVLARAGLSNTYSGRSVSDKMRQQIAKKMTSDQLLAEIKRVADTLSTQFLSQAIFNTSSTIHSKAIISRFGSWKSALSKVGLKPPIHSSRYSEDQYFENLLTVWSHYGRQPKYAEMNSKPSQITAGAYENKWGTWRKALLAFTEKMNSQMESPADLVQVKVERKPKKPDPPSINVRYIPIGLRYNVFRRDRFKCVICGASPATNLDCTLHVDHIVPVSRSGKTEISNLRTLCEKCNLGKSAKIEINAAT